MKANILDRELKVKAKIFSCLPLVALLVLIASSNLMRGQLVNVNCTDTSTDAATLNAAISGSVVGSEIAIHGTCLVNNTIVLDGDRSYIGDSRTGTIIRQAANTNLVAMLASDSWADNSSYTGDPIRIAHMTLDANSSGGNTSGTNALVIRSYETVVEDLLVLNASGDGIQDTNTSKNGTALVNAQENGRISDVWVRNSGANGIHIVDSGNSVTDTDILNSWIAQSGQSGINMGNAAGWKVMGNHIYTTNQNAIYANQCFGTTIADNYIEDFGDGGGSTTYYGIACTVQGAAASVISGNKVFQFVTETGSGNYVYIGVPLVNYDTGVINVVNNVINGANGAHDIGLLYESSGGVGLDVLSSNNVQNVTTHRTVGTGVTLVTAQ